MYIFVSAACCQGLESKVINSVAEILALKDAGKRLRHVGKTNMNAQSSRSHSIFTVTVETCEVRDDGQNHIRVRSAGWRRVALAEPFTSCACQRTILTCVACAVTLPCALH